MRQKNYKTVKKYFSNLQQLFKYASLATLSNVFQEFQVITEYIICSITYI